MNENEILREAYLNLENYEVPINEVVPNKIVIIDGKDFCSEKILDKKFLLQMHEKLNSENLIVSIPRRRCMMITAISEGEEIENQFISVHNNTLNDPSYGNAPITKNLFVITKVYLTPVTPAPALNQWSFVALIFSNKVVPRNCGFNCFQNSLRTANLFLVSLTSFSCYFMINSSSSSNKLRSFFNILNFVLLSILYSI